MRRFLGLLLWGLLSSSAASPLWSAKGHRIIARIAEQYLSVEARAALREHLSSMSIEEASVWADQVRSSLQYAHTASWHYATVPEEMQYDESLAPEEGDLITAIEEQLQRLTVPSSREERAFALRMLLHLIGDLHQPLHIGNGKDRGGNEVRLRFFGENASLHYLWDRDMIDTSAGSVSRWASRLTSTLSPKQRLQWTKGGPRDWLVESLSYRSKLYESLPWDSASSTRYYRRHLPLLEQLLLQAGLRLATLLNQLYD